MPKKLFWPIALVIMGVVFLSSNLGLLPSAFWNLWPIILIVVALGGVLTADRDEWLYTPTQPKKKTAKKTVKRTSRSKKR